ncbi:hypothetical protein ACFE04_000133 [Oxalis oulophora]
MADDDDNTTSYSIKMIKNKLQHHLSTNNTQLESSGSFDTKDDDDDSLSDSLPYSFSILKRNHPIIDTVSDDDAGGGTIKFFPVKISGGGGGAQSSGSSPSSSSAAAVNR